MLHLARLIYLLFPWASFSAGWCPLGVSPVDLPAYMYLRPRYQEPTQNFRVFVETLACPEFSGFFAPNCPPWLYCIFFGIPSLTVTFWGEIRLATQIAMFLRISAVVNTEKTNAMFFFEYLSLRFSDNLPFETGAPRKLAPRLVFIPAIENAWDLCSAVGQGIEF